MDAANGAGSSRLRQLNPGNCAAVRISCTQTYSSNLSLPTRLNVWFHGHSKVQSEVNLTCGEFTSLRCKII